MTETFSGSVIWQRKPGPAIRDHLDARLAARPDGVTYPRASMLGLISKSPVTLALVGGIPVIVLSLALIWARPHRTPALWGIVSILLVGGLFAGVWAALTSTGGGTATAAEAPAPGGNSSALATCSPSGTTLQITVHNIHYSTTCLAAPAGAPFTIDFNNQDPGTTHNLHIFTADPSTHPGAATLFAGELVTGVASATYQVGALSAGTYFFHCDVHPTKMFGTFIVAETG